MHKCFCNITISLPCLPSRFRSLSIEWWCRVTARKGMGHRQCFKTWLSKTLTNRVNVYYVYHPVVFAHAKCYPELRWRLDLQTKRTCIMPIRMTTTSVSTVRTSTVLASCSSAWWMWTIIRVSASSWFIHSFGQRIHMITLLVQM